GLVLIDRALMAWRWLLLLRPLTSEAPPPLNVVMRVFFVSTFVGTALPSVGGDAVRALSLRRHAVPGATAVASVAMDRALGVVAILLLARARLVTFTPPVRRGVFVILLLGGLASLGLALVIFSDAVASLSRRVAARLPGAWVRRWSTSTPD